MALRVSSFFFKRGVTGGGPVTPTQLAITKSEVETPGLATQSNIVAMYECDNSRGVTDPNTLGLYGSWTHATAAVYVAHTGILNDYGYGTYLGGHGIQKNGWGAGTLDTYYNTTGITLSWIQRLVPVTNARLMQYWQADTEFVELICLSSTLARLNITLGTGTLQYVDFIISDFNVNDGHFHHYVVSVEPTVERIARVFIDGALAGETAAVTGTDVFGTTATSVRRAISFGCLYTSPTLNVSGDVDHCVILRGRFAPDPKFFENKMVLLGDNTRYYGDQMTYNPT